MGLTTGVILDLLTYLGDHHVAVKCTSAPRFVGSLHMRPYFADDGRAEGDVGHKMAVHDVHMKPVCAILDCVGAGGA